MDKEERLKKIIEDAEVDIKLNEKYLQDAKIVKELAEKALEELKK